MSYAVEPHEIDAETKVLPGFPVVVIKTMVTRTRSPTS
jgi:hypothetical protein